LHLAFVTTEISQYMYLMFILTEIPLNLYVMFVKKKYGVDYFCCDQLIN